MKIYIGEFEGNHWAVESEMEKPPSWLSKETYNWTIWEEHLSSLPRTYQCSDSLVSGLKPGDELPPCEEGYEVKRLIDKNSVEYYWAEAYWKEYSLTNPDNRRIMLVPVEAKQNIIDLANQMFPNAKPLEGEELEALNRAFKKSQSQTQTNFTEAKQEQVLYDCEHCGWSGTEVKTIRLEDRCPRCNSLDINTYSEAPKPKPQEQGEDELWERAWEESCKYEYYDPEDDRFLKTKFFDYLKSKFTITRKG